MSQHIASIMYRVSMTDPHSDHVELSKIHSRVEDANHPPGHTVETVWTQRNDDLVNEHLDKIGEAILQSIELQVNGLRLEHLDDVLNTLMSNWSNFWVKKVEDQS